MTDTHMPKDKGLDHTLKLLDEAYRFITNRSEKFESRVFETTLLGEKTICMVGKKEAEVFYDNTKFSRKGASPGRIQKTLFGEGGVQGLDGKEHHHRKEMFMSLMTKEGLKQISAILQQEWEREMERQSKEEIQVYQAAKYVLTRSALRWTGVPYQESEIPEWTDQLSDMFEDAGSVGLSHWQARRSRSKAEKEVVDLVENVRAGETKVSEDSPVYHFAMHRDLNGELLDAQIVAVELLNLLRPIVAIAVYIDFLILAVHDYPEKVSQLENEDDLQHFIQEVRRFYPFFPVAPARVKEDFSWNGYTFEKGTLTLLDLYGTNHDPEIWDNPDTFQPERFQTWEGSPFDFIPQGGGEFNIGHRCAGEWITIDILKVTLDFFVHRLSFDFPEQDLDYKMNDIPPVPESGVVIKNVHLK
ncbi:cytochrome P450 [Oceanobacillus sp. J11TS1]|uniref:cytochrome P450 n=1 Tax=Oceanobacillus sp. J11TS1 TaxID=2807191 RepID=UPI001B085399|nr:cytochrome P450 [Oceanobacillus sp. J11TS1]GIO23073.1 fatty-acid peroxygenase [Oceanobacillus sp. J11TS1]